MKRFLLAVSVASATFFGGVLTTELFRLEQRLVSMPTVKEIKIAPISAFKVEALEIGEAAITGNSNDLSGQNDYGWYRLDASKGIKEVNMISLWRDYEKNDDGTISEKIVAGGGVFTSFENHGDQGFVDSAWAEIDDKKAKFRTNKIKGIEYRFEGVFYNGKTSGDDGEKVLRGVLRKYVKGKMVAEARGDYAYYEPHCWH